MLQLTKQSKRGGLHGPALGWPAPAVLLLYTGSTRTERAKHTAASVAAGKTSVGRAMTSDACSLCIPDRTNRGGLRRKARGFCRGSAHVKDRPNGGLTTPDVNTLLTGQAGGVRLVSVDGVRLVLSERYTDSTS